MSCRLAVSAVCFVMRNKLFIFLPSACTSDLAPDAQPWGIHKGTLRPDGRQMAVSGGPDLSVLCARAQTRPLWSARARDAVGQCCPTGVQHFCPTDMWGTLAATSPMDGHWPSLGDQCLHLLAHLRHLGSCEGRGGGMLSDDAVGRCCRTMLSDDAVGRSCPTGVQHFCPTDWSDT
jgi:hypothetical protein